MLFHRIKNGGEIIKKRDVVLKDKRSTYIDSRASIGKNVIIYENNRIDGTCVIEDNVTIFPNCFITSSFVGKGTKIYSSVIDRSTIASCSAIGPYSHIKRTKLAPHTKVGAFSEVKNCEFDEKVVIEPGSIMKNNEVVK